MVGMSGWVGWLVGWYEWVGVGWLVGMVGMSGWGLAGWYEWVGGLVVGWYGWVGGLVGWLV